MKPYKKIVVVTYNVTSLTSYLLGAA